MYCIVLQVQRRRASRGGVQPPSTVMGEEQEPVQRDEPVQREEEEPVEREEEVHVPEPVVATRGRGGGRRGRGGGRRGRGGGRKGRGGGRTKSSAKRRLIDEEDVDEEQDVQLDENEIERDGIITQELQAIVTEVEVAKEVPQDVPAAQDVNPEDVPAAQVPEDDGIVFLEDAPGLEDVDLMKDKPDDEICIIHEVVMNDAHAQSVRRELRHAKFATTRKASFTGTSSKSSYKKPRKK